MSNITASTDMTQCKPEDLAKFLDLFCQDVVQTVNGKLDFFSNFNCKPISVTFAAAATNVSAPHNLGRPPIGYLVVNNTSGAVVYDGTMGSTSQVINLRATAPGTIAILVF